MQLLNKIVSQRTGILLIPALIVSAAACDDEVNAPDPDNRPPTAAISAEPLNVPAGDNHQTIVVLDGRDSSDPDGDELSYEWTVPSGRFENGTSATDAVVEVTFPGAAPYTVTLVVDDGRGETASAEVTIGIQ